jgi:hypothetical protein
MIGGRRPGPGVPEATMRSSIPRLVTVLAVLAAALLAGAAPAGAAPASLQVTPATVPAGRTVTVSGTCEANSAGSVISHAFLHDATHDFAGVGAVSFTTGSTGAFVTHPVIPRSTLPGSYEITARCGGGNLGIAAHLTVTSASAGAPTAVPAGSGGSAATGGAVPPAARWLGGIGALLLLAGSAEAVRRRRVSR